MFLWIRKSIKNKLIFLVMSIIFFLGTVTVAITFLSNKSLLIEEGKGSLRGLATEESYIADKNVNTYVNTTKIMSVQPSIISYIGNPGQAGNPNVVSLLKKQNVNNIFEQISILNLSGVVSTSTDTSLIGKDYSKYSFFERALRGEESIDYTVDFQKGEVVYYTFSSVQKESGENIGFIVGQLPQNSLFSGLITGEVLAHSSNLMIVDSNGLIIYSKNKERLLQDISGTSELEKENIAKYSLGSEEEIKTLQYDMLKEDINNYKGPTNHTFADKKTGRKEMLAISRMESLPLFIVLGKEEAEVTRPALGMTTPIAMFAFLAVALSALYIRYFLNRLLKPIDILKKVLKSIGRGHLDQDVNIKTVDEFRDLGDAVVLMTLELKEKEMINKIKSNKKQTRQ